MIKRAVAAIRDRVQGRVPPGTARSGHWPKVRAAWLADHDSCAACGGTKKLEVHHVRPFHLHPELELDQTNFISLCEAGTNGINCHLNIGHSGSFQSYNPNVRADAVAMFDRIHNRPLADSAV